MHEHRPPKLEGAPSHIAKSTLSEQKEKVIKYHLKPIPNIDIVIKT